LEGQGRFAYFGGGYEKSAMELVGAKSRRQHRGNWAGAAGRCRRYGCRRGRLARAVASADHLFGSDPCSARAADHPGPAIVPPAGLSPLLTQPGPVFATPQQSMPAYPSPQYPGSIGEQNTRAYHNRLLQQQWLRDRAGINPGSERSREIQQQLNQPSSR
jgi:hypothetical protein